MLLAATEQYRSTKVGPQPYKAFSGCYNDRRSGPKPQRWSPKLPGSPVVAVLLAGKETHMTAATDGSTAERGEQPPERITVALIPKAATDLQHLQDRTNLSKTDIVNRAITLYEFVDEQMRAGRDLLIRDNKTGETQLVRFL
jgi:hypothetical protein